MEFMKWFCKNISLHMALALLVILFYCSVISIANNIDQHNEMRDKYNSMKDRSDCKQVEIKFQTSGRVIGYICNDGVVYVR